MDLCRCANSNKQNLGGNATQYSTWEDATQNLYRFEISHCLSLFIFAHSCPPRNEIKGQGPKEK